MELTVAERLALLTLLPAQGDLTTMRIMRQLREALSFDEAEHAVLNFRQEGERLNWEDNGHLKDVEIGAKATGIIADVLLELNKREEVRDEHLSLFDKLKVEGD